MLPVHCPRQQQHQLRHQQGPVNNPWQLRQQCQQLPPLQLRHLPSSKQLSRPTLPQQQHHLQQYFQLGLLLHQQQQSQLMAHCMPPASSQDWSSTSTPCRSRAHHIPSRHQQGLLSLSSSSTGRWPAGVVSFSVGSDGCRRPRRLLLLLTGDQEGRCGDGGAPPDAAS